MNHEIEDFVDDELSIPGHTALVAHNHNTCAQSLSCEECAENLGRFEATRWRDKNIRDAWNRHVAGTEEDR